MARARWSLRWLGLLRPACWRCRRRPHARSVPAPSHAKPYPPLTLPPRPRPQSAIGGDEYVSFLRHAELKHGRVAMAAITGFLVHINGIHFPGMLSPSAGLSFADLSAMGPFEAWTAVPLAGQIQFLVTMAGLEHASECLNPDGHYMRGGTPGDLKFMSKYGINIIPTLEKLSPEERARKRLSELKNGRMAMLAMAGICSAMSIEGSVPLLANAPKLTGEAFALPFGTF